jgi:hypothetical protein
VTIYDLAVPVVARYATHESALFVGQLRFIPTVTTHSTGTIYPPFPVVVDLDGATDPEFELTANWTQFFSGSNPSPTPDWRWRLQELFPGGRELEFDVESDALGQSPRVRLADLIDTPHPANA